MNPIEKNARLVLGKLFDWRGETFEADGQALMSATQLTAEDVNDAVSYLTEIGAVEPMGGIGTDPFDFADVKITPKGKRTHHDWTSKPPDPTTPDAASVVPHIRLYPVGSPFGFKLDDWDFVSERQGSAGKLYVVTGLQYESKHYDAETLLANLKSRFESALRAHNANGQKPTVEFLFERLGAGYGEHLFNQIARCIIGADIAVFDTSDLNPNVMIELGVALTWGVCVLPVRAEGAPPMPSDISGQTWVKHRDSGREFLDAGFDQKLMDLVRRALKGKPRELRTGSADSGQQDPAPTNTERDSLQTYKTRFEAFLRHLGADWKAERDSEPTNVDDAKVILETARRGAVEFRAMITRAEDPALPNLLDEAARRLKQLVRNELYMDGGKSWKHFWSEAEAVIDLLHRVPVELDRVLTGGTGPVPHSEPDDSAPAT